MALSHRFRYDWDWEMERQKCGRKQGCMVVVGMIDAM